MKVIAALLLALPLTAAGESPGPWVAHVQAQMREATAKVGAIPDLVELFEQRIAIATLVDEGKIDPQLGRQLDAAVIEASRKKGAERMRTLSAEQAASMVRIEAMKREIAATDAARAARERGEAAQMWHYINPPRVRRAPIHCFTSPGIGGPTITCQ
jgi:hypothetical protein